MPTHFGAIIGPSNFPGGDMRTIYSASSTLVDKEIAIDESFKIKEVCPSPTSILHWYIKLVVPELLMFIHVNETKLKMDGLISVNRNVDSLGLNFLLLDGHQCF